MNRWCALAMLLAVAGALALRVPHLGLRPLHNDEAVNAIKVSELWERGHYFYDPDEYHGPTLHYITRPILALSGAQNADELKDETLRIAPLILGTALILLLLLFADGLGRSAVIWAAIFIAISPAMVFYSRYFIHEMLLVFFTALTMGAAWRYVQTRKIGWATMTGSGLGLMFTTKETFVITLGAMGLALMITVAWAMPSPRRFEDLRAWWNGKHMAAFFGVTFVIWLLLFSSCMANFQGLPDSFLTYLPWIKRAGGHSPHIHPWYFYLERLAWFRPPKGPVSSEGLVVVLAVVGIAVSLAGKKSPLHQFLALFTIILTGCYSAISYKTPWCLLNFYLGMILLAGIGATAVVEFFRARTAQMFAGMVLVALAGQLAWQAWRANFIYSADPRNPYVYAQTSPDLTNLVQRVEGIGKVSPEGYNTVVKVIAPESDYWPLPWQLRRFKNVGWYEKLPEEPFSPVIVVSSKLDARLDEKSDKKWIMAGISQLRPGVFLELYVEFELWKKYVETLPHPAE